MNPVTHARRIFNTSIQLYTLHTAYKICQPVQVNTVLQMQTFEQQSHNLAPSNIHNEHKWPPFAHRFLCHHRPPVWHFQKRKPTKETETSSTSDAEEETKLLTKMEVSEIIFRVRVSCPTNTRLNSTAKKNQGVSVGTRVFGQGYRVVEVYKQPLRGREGWQAQIP